jgi:bifunctional non-homologous end joining protein LigD
MARQASRVAAEASRTIEVQGHRLTLTHLDKVLYPESSTTKAEVLSYYGRIAPVMLPHLARRPVTVVRAPDGVDGHAFYQKHLPRGAPPWIATIPVPRRQAGGGRDGGSGGSGGRAGTIDYPAVDGAAALLWMVNQAALEIHVPMWRAGSRRRPRRPDLLVFDLDPGEPAGLAECCVAARAVRAALEGHGITSLAKTSGSKGLQVYGRRPGRGGPADTVAYARDVARTLEREHPGEIVSNMRRDLRRGKVLVDWSQNQPTKTTVAPYSLRLRHLPWVSAPLTWDEVDDVAGGADADALRFQPHEVLERVSAGGDLFAPLLGEGSRPGRLR